MVNSWDCDVPKKPASICAYTIVAIWFGEAWASGVPELMDSKTHLPACQSKCILGRKSKRVMLSHILLGAFGNCACPCWGHRYSGAILNRAILCICYVGIDRFQGLWVHFLINNQLLPFKRPCTHTRIRKKLVELFCPKFKCNRLDCPSGFGDLNLYHGLLCNGDSSRFRQLGRSTEPQTSCRNVSVNEAGLCRLRLKYVNGCTLFAAFSLKHMPCLIFVGGVGFQMLGRNCHMQPFGHCMICHLHAMGSPSCSANSSYKILVTPACLASKEGREFHELIMESSTQNISKRTLWVCYWIVFS